MARSPPRPAPRRAASGGGCKVALQSLAALVFTVSVIVNLRGLRSQSRLRSTAAARASSAPRAGGGDALKLAIVARGPDETIARLASYVGARRGKTLVYNRIPKTGSTSLTQSLNWLATESGGRFRDRSTPFDVEVLGREWWWDERDVRTCVAHALRLQFASGNRAGQDALCAVRTPRSG